MPQAPLRPCLMPGCPALVQRGRCAAHERHARREYETRPARRAEVRLYHSAAWLKLRAQCLALHPWCADHLARGERVPSTEVDHVLPVHEGGAPLDPCNLAALCKACHSRRTMAQQRRRGRL